MALIGVAGGDTWPPATQQKGPAVKRYDVVINGIETTLQLSDEDAKARGLKANDEPKTKARQPANKQAAAPNKSKANG